MKVEDVAKDLVKKAGLDWNKLDNKDIVIYKNIARAIMIVSSDIDKIEE
jgi:hypothetical protein